MARVVGLEVVATVALASVAGESWVLAPLYHTERPVHVLLVALCEVLAPAVARERARAQRL